VIEQLESQFADLGVSLGSMFGAPALFFDGKAFACEKRGYFGAKLGAGTPEHGEALTLPGAELFDPSGSGRPFRDWVAVPAGDPDAAARLARQAYDRLRAPDAEG
jgi:hypothetical protein